MINGLYGRKIGMTQIFSEKNRIIPVTVIDASGWMISQIKTKDKDGYDSVQVALLRNKYLNKNLKFDLNEKKNIFRLKREIKLKNLDNNLKIGDFLKAEDIISNDEIVDISGITKGCGFAGVVKRYGFSGGPASHGSCFGRFTGSLSFMRKEGKVPKGKKLPGNMGNEKKTIKNLVIKKIMKEDNIFLVKGSIPGKSGSVVFIRKK